jgi:hypothetical protein
MGFICCSSIDKLPKLRQGGTATTTAVEGMQFLEKATGATFRQTSLLQRRWWGLGVGDGEEGIISKKNERVVRDTRKHLLAEVD